ncbi:hypothetical protein BGZ96_009380 [Linnemannia gamsii]|uniref:NACHT domain-containing protein n=1 Tax=Linnemannia gamsii TaxID=64522 RepID=A0ABQ7JWL9_9FUNG|nr:hypothetical protein BGZ96_009380 [Linnemannia gamsii]
MSSLPPQGNPPPPHPDPASPSSTEHLQLTNDGKRNLSQLERQTKFGRRTSNIGDISAAVHEVSSSGVTYPGTSTLSTLSSPIVSSPPLDHMQEIPTIEQALLTLRTQRLTEYQQKVYIAPLAKPNPQAPDDNISPLMGKVEEFLAGNGQVMLILGDSGAGKSTFNRHLEYLLWQDYKAGDSIPLFINLPAIDRPDKTLIAKQLTAFDFTEGQICELRQMRQLLLICDGYDESQLTANLHTTNLLNQSGQWNVKMLITCRTQYLGPDYRDRFMPKTISHYDRTAKDLFQEAVIVPFSQEQIQDYVEQYVPLEPRTWRTEDYMDKLATIPDLMDLVKNPFLLLLALETLPGVIKGKQDLSTIKVTRVQLYDTFVRHWLAVNKRRLERNVLIKEEGDMLELLLDAGFFSMGVGYATGLASAIFEHQGGNPVVQYDHVEDEKSWRAEFFGPDLEVRMLRESSPLTRTGTQFQFLHRSMLEYFFSLTVFDPSNHKDQDDFAPQSDASSSVPALSDANVTLFKRSLLTEPSVILFLCERVKQHSDFEKQLQAVIQQSKTDATAATAAANAITILARAGVRFNSADLRGIRIPGADLTGGQFDSAQLQDSDLTGVNFTKTWIRQADLSRAGMNGTQFGELPYLEESNEVSSCAFSPDGEFLAAGLENGDINIYDTETWEMIQEFQRHRDRVTSLAYSPDSQQLLSGSYDKRARLWNCETGSTDFIMKGHSDVVKSVVFSPTGQQVATADKKSIRLWDARTGAAVFVLTDDIDKITSIAYSPDGNTITSIGEDKMIRIFDTLTGLPLMVFSKDEHHTCLAYSHDGRQIATGSVLCRLQLWEATATILEPGRKWKAHLYSISDVTFSPDDRWIASSSYDRTVKLWDTRSGALISSFISHTGLVNCVRFAPNGSYIASASKDNTLRLWEVNLSDLKLDPQDYTTNSADGRQVFLGSPPDCATYSPSGRQLITGSPHAPIRQFNADSGDVEFVFPDHLYSTRCIAFSPDGLQLAIGDGGNVVKLWSVESCTVSLKFCGHEIGVNSVAFSPCGDWLASGSDDKTVRLWDTRSGAAGLVLIGHTGEIQSIHFSRDGHWIASACMEGKILLWEVSTGELKADTTISNGRYGWNIVAYNPGCLQVASSHGDGDIRLWDDDQQLQGFRYIVKQYEEACHFAFSTCGQWVATAHYTSVRLWRLPSPDLDQQALPLQDQDYVSEIEGFTRAVDCVVWRPNKLEFATVSSEGSIRAWRVMEDTNGSGRASVRLLWSSGPSLLVASGAILRGTVGLSSTNRWLFEQRGAK